MSLDPNKEHILLTIKTLRERPNIVHCGKRDFYSTRMFIEGYFWALKKSSGVEYSKELSVFFARKYGTGSSLAYVLYPDFIHHNISDKEKIEILLDGIEEYLNSNNE